MRLIELAGSTGIGDKRNFGCAQTDTELICHWDDDDFSAPGRLQDQVDRLIASGKAVTGYHSMRFTDGVRWWKYSGDPGYSLGTSLMYHRGWWEHHPFPSLQVGEDNQFVSAASSIGAIATADAGDLMHATIHPGNTSPRMMGDSWKLLP